MSDAAGSNEHVLIVGGGPAGLAVAQAYRDAGGTRPVVLVAGEGRLPYARPPLTKDYLRGEADADELPLVDDAWYRAHDVDVRLGVRATGLDTAARTLTLSDATVLGYGDVVLATGSSPKPLPVPGGDLPGVVLVRDVDSSDAMRALAEPGRRIIVLGSGFIGCEAASSMAARGATVLMATPEDVPHASRLGPDAGGRIASWLRSDGVDVRTGAGASRVKRRGDGWRVTLDDGAELDVDGVVSGSGARPNVELAEAAGVPLESGGVRTDASMRTATPGVWAVGDIAYAFNPAAGRHLRVEHWGEAEAMGAVAGRALAGEDDAWAQAPGFWSTIGGRTMQYVAWGDGYDDAHLVEGDGGGWTVWYGRDDVVVGVLTHEAADDSERGRALVEAGAPWREVAA